MNNKNILLLIFLSGLLLTIFSFCESGSQESNRYSHSPERDSVVFTGFELKIEDRTQILERLKEKSKDKKMLVVHAFVPLCDNIHQGIVPVNNQLGDGKNLRTNLYWGAGYGVKSYFKKYDGWKYQMSFTDSVGPVLERAVFSRKNSKGVTVYLVADAYAGDKMKDCLHDYFRSLGGWKTAYDSLMGHSIPLYGNADLIIFNGHDGLMDDTLKTYFSKDSIARETVTIACYAKHFFNPRFEKCGAYPLVGTSGLLAPEAYVMSAVIMNWAEQKSAQEIKTSAGDAYHAKHPKTTVGGARALFTTGW